MNIALTKFFFILFTFFLLNTKNYRNEDQSSFSSHSIHSKHCTLSVDELFLKSSHHQQTTTATLLQAAAAAAAAGIGVGVGSPDDGDDDGIYDDLIQMDLDDNNNKHDTNSGSSNVGNTVNNKKNKHSRLVDELCRNLIHLKTATSLDNCSDSRKSNSNTTIKSIISNTKDNEQSIKAVVDSTNNDFDHNHSQNNNNKNNRHHRESIATTTITTNMKKPKQRKKYDKNVNLYFVIKTIIYQFLTLISFYISVVV